MSDRKTTASPGTFQRFLARSLEVLESELPAGYAAVVERLGSAAVQIEVDGERLGVVGNNGRLRIVSHVLRPTAAARGTSRALREILEGERTLESAVLAETIDLQGTLVALAAFHETLHAYFNAAVRCPSFAALLDQYFEAQARSELETH